MQKERIHWIDSYKGFLILLVVLGHVISSYRNSGFSNHMYEVIFSVIYSFHMASFMFISGYLCKIKDGISRKKQILHKLITYGIPYIIFSFVWVLFKIAFSKYTNSSVSIYDFLLIAIYPISFMWYLYATMIMNIIQVLIEKIKRKYIFLIISGAFLLLAPFIDSFYSDFSDYIISDFMLFWFYFLIGHYYGDRIIHLFKNKMICIASIFTFIVFNVLFFKTDSILSQCCKFFTSISGIIITIGLFYTISSNKILEYCGKKSLAIYVLQGIVIAATRIIIGKIPFLSDSYGIIPLIVCTMSGIMFPLIVELICTKVGKIDFVFYPNKYLK